MTVPGQTASRGDASNRLSVNVWYPAAAGTAVQPLEIGPPGSPLFSEDAAAENAPLAESPARFPLVVVSHGTGGTAMDLSWLCIGLAARGYIVASVEHPGNNALGPQTVAGNTLWGLRADDLSRGIDGVLASPRFGPRIDRSRIGAAGFSLGGYTVLELAGARADASRLDAYCTGNRSTPLCSGEATPAIPDLIAKSKALAAADPQYRAALADNADSHRDPRVRAVFSIAPALGPAIVPESLAAVVVPVEIVAGFGDPILPVDDNAIADARAIPDARLSLLPRSVAHYTFLTDCAPAGRERFAPICADAGRARRSVHRETRDLALSFFDRTLAAIEAER
jgi:predicted dienelactone hydrolase